MKLIVFTYREKEDGVNILKALFSQAKIEEFEVIDLSYIEWKDKLDIAVSVGPTASKYASPYVRNLVRLSKTSALVKATGNEKSRAEAWSTVKELTEQLKLIDQRGEEHTITLSGIQVDGIKTDFVCSEEDLRFYEKMMKAFKAEQIVVAKRLKE